MVEAAIRNRVFDVLGEGPKSLEQLVAATDASERGLKALLNALVGIGLLNRKGARYQLPADVAAFLVQTKPSFMGGLFLHGSTHLIPNWLQLAEIVRTGKPVGRANDASGRQRVLREICRRHLQHELSRRRRLPPRRSSRKPSSQSACWILAAGSGVWGIAMAEQSPHVRVTAVDWPGVIPVTKRVAAKHGVADRFDYVAGDILKVDLGKDHQVATLGHILAQRRCGAESAAAGTRLRSAWRPAARSSSRNSRRTRIAAGPPMPLIFASTCSSTRTTATYSRSSEIKAWLKATGFRKVRQLNAPGPSPLILATKP